MHNIKTTVALSRLRLPRHNKIHGRKQLFLPALDQTIGSDCKAVSRLLCSRRHEPDPFQRANCIMGDVTSPFRHTCNRDHIPQRLRHAQIPIEGVIPGPGVFACSEVFVEFELKAGGSDGLEALGDADHVRDSVALLDSKADAAVLGVVVVVGICHEPFVNAEDAAGFEHAENLGVDALEGGGVHGGFDCIDGVKAVVWEGHLLNDS